MEDRQTKRMTVLKMLCMAARYNRYVMAGKVMEAREGYVYGPHMQTDYTGGIAGDRRRRELVEIDGWTISKKKFPDRDAWYYRLEVSKIRAEYLLHQINAGQYPTNLNQSKQLELLAM